MRRAALLAIAILACLAQAGDTLRIRASICQDRKCMKRTQVAFAPARVRVEVFVPRALDGRRMAYGVVCDGAPVTESIVDVDADYAPLYIAEYPGIDAGECYAEAHLIMASGRELRQRSGALIIRPSR